VESASKYNNWGRLSKLKAKILHRQKTGAPGNALQGELEEVSETEKNQVWKQTDLHQSKIVNKRKLKVNWNSLFAFKGEVFVIAGKFSAYNHFVILLEGASNN